MRINVTAEHIQLFKCLASETRLKMIQLMAERPRNISEMANELHVSPGIITRHIDDMEQCNLVKTEVISGQRGAQKLCALCIDDLSLVFREAFNGRDSGRQLSIPVGQYSAYDVTATCGLCSTSWIIGMQDDPRYFSTPERINAGLIWFTSGWVEYTIPCFMFAQKPVKSISISMEICSEAPDYNDDFPSDIYFFFNGKKIGYWTSPGDFGTKRGYYTPSWWVDGCQYGMLKTIKITEKGVMIDGDTVSSLTLKNILGDGKKDLIMRIESPADAKNPGGVTIHGKGFGNYDRDIEVEIEFYE